jgi:hypothetical protein
MDTLPDVVKLVNYLGYHIDSAKSDINKLYDLYNIAFAPEDMMEIVESLLGYTIDNTTEQEFDRRNILKIVEKFKHKGTALSLKDLMNELDYKLTINTLWTRQRDIYANVSVI